VLSSGYSSLIHSVVWSGTEPFSVLFSPTVTWNWIIPTEKRGGAPPPPPPPPTLLGSSTSVCPLIIDIPQGASYFSFFLFSHSHLEYPPHHFQDKGLTLGHSL